VGLPTLASSGPTGKETNGIPKSLRDSVGPILKLAACPLKAMILMAELPGRQCFQISRLYSTFGVVTTTVCGQANSKSTRSNAKRRGGVLVFNDFYDSCSVEAEKAFCPGRSENHESGEYVPFCIAGISSSRSFCEAISRARCENVHPNNVRESSVLQELS